MNYDFYKQKKENLFIDSHFLFKIVPRWGSKLKAMQELAWVPKLLLGEETF